MTRVVVDADIARSAGASEGMAKACRAALEAARESSLQLVWTPSIRLEWQRHQSKFARKWLRSMYARKLVHGRTDAPHPGLRSACYALPVESGRTTTLKDVHLLEAAIATDQRLLSRDENARTTFSSLEAAAHILGAIHWGNPTQPACLSWIERGLPTERAFRLIPAAPLRRRARGHRA